MVLAESLQAKNYDSGQPAQGHMHTVFDLMQRVETGRENVREISYLVMQCELVCAVPTRVL